MAQGPSLIFDKSSFESLNLDKAVMMDNFYMSTITPLFLWNALPTSTKLSAATAHQNSWSDRSPTDRRTSGEPERPSPPHTCGPNCITPIDITERHGPSGTSGRTARAVR